MHAVYKYPVFIYDGTNGPEIVQAYDGEVAFNETFVREDETGLVYLDANGLERTYEVGLYLVVNAGFMSESAFQQFYYVLPEATPLT